MNYIPSEIILRIDVSGMPLIEAETIAKNKDLRETFLVLAGRKVLVQLKVIPEDT
jgi:hypothetical protein